MSPAASNPVTVAARIQGHPSRKRLHGPLLEALAPLKSAVLSTHASSPPNPLQGYLKTLTDITESTHLLVIQDDAVVCKNFAPAVERIAAANPDVPVSLFLAKLPVREATLAKTAMRNGEHYIDALPRNRMAFIPIVAVLWPTEKAIHFRDWCRAHWQKLPGWPKYEPASDDGAFANWAIFTHQRVRIAVPSLVEHPDMEPSLIGRKAKWGKDKGRVALFYCGESDPLDYDWS